MSRRIIRSVIVLALISFLGITALQIFWFSKAYSFEEKQFEDQVFIALNAVAEQVYSLKKDNAEIEQPVRQVTGNYFVVQINDTLHPYLLENLLIQELKKRNLAQRFEYAIYDCFTDSIVFGKAVDMKENHSEPAQYLQNIVWERDGHYFGIYFPEKSALVFSNLGAWIYSSILLVIITLFFTYTLFVILQQKKLSEVRTDFINNMTHELKTPIATIGLTASALKNPKVLADNDRLGNYINIITEESHRLKTLVERVLQASNAESTTLQLNKEKIDLNELLKTIVGQLSNHEKNPIIKLDLQEELPSIYVDRFHINNVIFNVLENAIKYCDRIPEIEISTSTQNKKVVLVMSDNGIGIPKQHTKKIFDKFYRVPKGDLHETKGYGLGLFYVNQIIKKHGAKIKLRSEIDLGSTFTITFDKAY